MKQLFKVFMAAAVIIFASCQKNDLNEPGKNETGTATLTASIGDMTKVGLEEDAATSGLKVTWSVGDKIGLYDESGDYACVFALKAGEEGKTKAEFIAQGGSFDPTKTYTAVYPHIAGTLDLTEYADVKTSRLAADQTQDGATLDHLAKLCFMEGVNNQNSITLVHTISILTLELEKPAAAGNEVLTTIGFTNDSKSYTLNLTNGDWTKPAYMIIDPIATPARDLSFEVTTDAGNLFNFSVQTSKEYEAGKRYTAKLIDGKLGIANFMKFTVDTRKNTANTSDKTFIMPFANNGVLSGYGITIEWGDGQKSSFPDGATVTQATLTHAYATAGQYQITIRSTETNSAKKQILIMNFYNNYRDVNNNPAKLISMDTPMLNTAETDFKNCFTNCSNLTTIAPGLFDNHTEATSFNSVFSGCSSLTTVPDGLFDKNTLVTNFGSIFNSCTSLTAIPDGLFDKNILVTNFEYGFAGCSSLTTILPGLFDENTEVTSFADCFSTCTGLTTIPTEFFAKNTKVTIFKGCFYGCFKLQLHPNIFCNEATEKATRFAGKTVDFTVCFNRASFTGIKGTAPALWDGYAGTLTKIGCFGDKGNSATSITNYGDIPANWK